MIVIQKLAMKSMQNKFHVGAPDLENLIGGEISGKRIHKLHPPLVPKVREREPDGPQECHPL